LVSFFNEDVDFSHESLSDIPAWVNEVISLESFSLTAISYIFCSDKHLLSINREFLQHDYFTDIITFDNSDEINLIEGDIFISIERVQENAGLHQTTFFSELLRVLIHGVLHLLGHNDHDDFSKSQMRTLEDKYIDLYFRSFHRNS
jgi:rRNA maturation RNase YbeY